MEIKLIEVRDVGTMIPMMAIQLAPEEGSPNASDAMDDVKRLDAERWLLERAGYNERMLLNPMDGDQYILLINLVGGEVNATYDPYGWNTNARTIPVVHNHLIDHWSEVASGDVVDVEVLLGVTTTPKVSERLFDT